MLKRPFFLPTIQIEKIFKEIFAESLVKGKDIVQIFAESLAKEEDILQNLAKSFSLLEHSTQLIIILQH